MELVAKAVVIVIACCLQSLNVAIIEGGQAQPPATFAAVQLAGDDPGATGGIKAGGECCPQAGEVLHEGRGGAGAS